MFKKIIIFIFSILLSTGLYFIISYNLFSIGIEQFPKIEKSFTNGLKNVEKIVNNPPPLISEKNALDSFLTKTGTLQWTNIQRYQTEKLPTLLQNNLLDEIAMQRLDDMFAKQYFEHVSPDGTSASDLAKNIDYEFISIGENIALGNFENDQILVQAWMDSPGHRANILNNTYLEIGIAVKKGLYQKQETWIGVQIFAKPFSACPGPSENMEIEIETIKDEIATLQNLLFLLEKEIEKMKPVQRENIKIYNKKVNTYNKTITEINSLIETQKELVAEYNYQINLQNECIKK